MSIDSQPITIEARLLFQLLEQVADGSNGTTAYLANRLAKEFDPDEGPIVIFQGPSEITELRLVQGGMRPPRKTVRGKRGPSNPRTPSGSQ